MPRPSVPARWLALYLLVAVTAQVWPGYAWAGARIEPRVLGLPFSFAWIIGWVAATFGALIVFHRAEEKHRMALRERGGR